MTIDSYAHVGLPRFLSAADTWEAVRRDGSQKAVLVLGPGHPDIAALISAHTLGGDRVRTIGIPYGSTTQERDLGVELCLRAGAMGIRMQGEEIFEAPQGLRTLGEQGRWLYATDPLRSPRHSVHLLGWLERYPQAAIAAPHFLSPHVALLQQDGAVQLLAHPRFYPILSRHGGCSRAPDPHEDLRPWLDQVISTCGWQRLLWGSELPVLYWREETVPQARAWLSRLGVTMNAAEAQWFYHDNAQHLFFDSPAPACTLTMNDIPEWIRNFSPWPLKVLNGQLTLAPQTAVRLFQAYHRQLNACPQEQPTLSTFLSSQLDQLLTAGEY